MNTLLFRRQSISSLKLSINNMSRQKSCLLVHTRAIISLRVLKNLKLNLSYLSWTSRKLRYLDLTLSLLKTLERNTLSRTSLSHQPHQPRKIVSFSCVWKCYHIHQPQLPQSIQVKMTLLPTSTRPMKK